MKYLAALLALAVVGCADHHDLTQCKGPYLALSPPSPPPAAVVPPAPLPLMPSRPSQQTANAPDATTRGVFR